MPDCGQCQSSEPSVRSCVTKPYSKVALLHSEAGHRDKGKGRCQHLSCLQPTNSYNGKVLKAQAQLGFLVLLLQLRALVTSVCAGRCQQYYWADAMGSHHGHITHVLTSRKGHGVSKVSRQVLRELCKTPHLQGNSRRITALQNQPFPNYTLDFRSTCSRHTSSASQRTTTSHSPCTLSQAPTHDRNEMYFSHEDLRQNKPFPM